MMAERVVAATNGYPEQKSWIPESVTNCLLHPYIFLEGIRIPYNQSAWTLMIFRIVVALTARNQYTVSVFVTCKNLNQVLSRATSDVE